jgi:glycine/D-amino acid oxidase-like deaminating enzyme
VPLQGCNVMIAGGGIGGMTAALLLGSAGASVRLLERVAEPAAVGAGLLLQPNGLAVLYALGLAEQLQRAAWRTPPAAIRDAADRLARLSRLSHPVLRWGRDVALRRLGRLATGPRRQERVQQEDPAWLYAAARTLHGREGYRH